jgi:uncharacterized membrane protein YfcA
MGCCSLMILSFDDRCSRSYSCRTCCVSVEVLDSTNSHSSKRMNFWTLFSFIFCSLRSDYLFLASLDSFSSIGLDKGGLPGVAALGMALALSTPLSDSSITTGHVLALFVPVLSLADLGAVYQYSQYIQCNILKQLALPTLLGLFLGFSFLGSFSDHLLRLSAGFALLLIALLHFALPSLLKYTSLQLHTSSSLPFTDSDYRSDDDSKTSMKKWLSSLKIWIFGGSIGYFTIISNIAGPIAVIFFIQLNLQKNELNGTRSCLFLLINCLKIPIQIWLGNILFEDLTLIGMLCGVSVMMTFITASYLMPYLHQESFVTISWTLVIVSALKLILQL